MQRSAVIIVTWNSSPFIDQVLIALERQTIKPCKTLIIDNNSSDAAAVKNIVARYSGCEFVALDKNVGFAAANNIGIERCDDVEFVALLNPDAFPEPEWLGALLKSAMQHPDAAAFASRLLNYRDPSTLDGAGDLLTITGRPWRRGHGTCARNAFTKDEVVFSPCAAAALYRLDAIRMIGGFDESFFCYVEDIDLAFRLLLLGHTTRYVSTAVALHVGSATTGRHSDFSVYYGQRNLVFNFIKNMPPVLFWCLLLPHIVLNILFVIAAMSAGRGNTALRAKLDAIKAIPQLWAQRRQIQKNRITSSLAIFKALAKRFF
ncbi:MAG TPA: glycosyltransferase family 2 protein [Spongiibacteraceae bacterium]|nr:glycosyltransferase family 2 protein [Spongiibacteraceae bacterium]